MRNLGLIQANGPPSFQEGLRVAFPDTSDNSRRNPKVCLGSVTGDEFRVLLLVTVCVIQIGHDVGKIFPQNQSVHKSAYCPKYITKRPVTAVISRPGSSRGV
jgi:hypothetical protein